jgi:apolipoprotein N-acyltransferase
VRIASHHVLLSVIVLNTTVSGYAGRAGYFTVGAASGVVQAAGVPVGVTTCWEVTFDRSTREAVLNGAQMLAVPSNNATFNEQMSRQQLAFAKIRASRLVAASLWRVRRALAP